MDDPVSAHELAQLCKTLSVDTRVRILQLLQDHPLCVNALAARLGVTHSAVSQHLRIMKAAGLVRAEKRGYWVHYRRDDEALQHWKDAILGLLGQQAGPSFFTSGLDARADTDRKE